jgi:DNA invertase Pin-like site-specific DNA recombinase
MVRARMRSRPDTPRPVRVFGYTRVSGREQGERGTSLDGQRAAIAQACEARDWPAPDVRVEVESAGEEHIERRTELHRLISDAQPGDAIVVAKLDRWSRDIVFGVQSIRASIKRGVGFVSADEGIDAATAHGDEQLGIRLWVAEQERRRIRERTVGRREALRAKGLWATGIVPFGYVRGSREERRQLYLSIDPVTAKIVVEVYQRIAGGESLRDISDWLQTIPGAPRSFTSLHRIVKARIYLGEIRVLGEWIHAVHPPIVTRDLWERAQSALVGRRCAGPAPTGAKTEDLLLRGFVRCSVCGSRCGITFGRFGHRYYVCAKRRHARLGGCSGAYYRTDSADESATAAVLARILHLRAVLERPAAPRAAPKARDLGAERRRVAGRLERAVELAVSGAITASELATQRAKLDADLGALARLEADEEHRAKASSPAARQTTAMALRLLSEGWAVGTPEERRQAIRLLASRVEVTEEKALRWTWKTVSDLPL